MARTKSATETGNYPVGDSALDQNIWWFAYADGFTLSAWVRPTTFGGLRMGTVLGKFAPAPGGSSYWGFGLEPSTGKIKFEAGVLGGPPLENVNWSASTGLTLGIWQFIAVVRDGVARTITAYLSKYIDVDVSSDGSTADVTTAAVLGNNTSGLGVGVNTFNNLDNFIGDFGHVSIVKKALTLGELRNLKMGRLESAEVINDWRMISHVYSPGPTLEADYAHQSATPAWGKYSLRVDTVHLAETNPPVPKPWGLEGPYNTVSPAARGSRTFYRKPFFCPR